MERGIGRKWAGRCCIWAMVALCTCAAAGQDRYWVGGSGDWSNAANWGDVAGGAGGAGMPDAHHVSVRFDDAVERTIQIAPPPGAVWTVRYLQAGNTAGTRLTLLLPSGSFHNTGQFLLGDDGSATFIQSGGEHRLDFGLNVGAGTGDGLYHLQGGALRSEFLRVGGSGATGVLRQTGGTHTGTDIGILDGGRYELTAGALDVTGGDNGMLHVSDGLFEQSGGAVAARSLDVRGEYKWTAGSLDVTEHWLIARKMSFPSTPTAVSFNGFFEIHAHAQLNAPKVSLTLGPNALFSRPQDFDPASHFAHFENQGLEHVLGTTLVIPAGRSIKINTVFNPFEADTESKAVTPETI